MSKKFTAEEVKTMILDVASTLFVEKGYEKTSISDIEKRLDGLTRGAIYHHFSNKEKIIHAVVRRLLPNEEALSQIDSLTEYNGLQKIRALLLESLFNEEANASMNEGFLLLHDPKFYSIYTTQIVDEIGPQLERYLIEGNSDSSVDVKQPRQMAEVIILLVSTWFIPSLFPTTMETFFKKLETCKTVLAQSGVDIFGEEVLEEIMMRLMKNVEEKNEE